MSILHNIINVLLLLIVFVLYLQVLRILAKIARSIWNSARCSRVRRLVEKAGDLVNKLADRIQHKCSQSYFLSLLVSLVLIFAPFVILLVVWRVSFQLFRLICIPKVW
jgi:hypothetical protein